MERGAIILLGNIGEISNKCLGIQRRNPVSRGNISSLQHYMLHETISRNFKEQS